MGTREDIFAVAMNASAVGMAIVDVDGRFLDVNPALCEFLGRTQEELEAATWQSLTHPDDLAVDESLVADVLSGRRDTYRLRKRYLRRDGSGVIGDLSVGCVRTADGSVEFFVSQIVDVTAQVAAEDRYRILAENVSDAVAVGSNDGVMLWVSGAVEETLGFQPDELVGRHFRDLVHEDDRATAGRGQQALLAGEGVEFEVRMTTKAGGYRWMNVRVRPTFDDAGQVTGRIGSWWDIDEEHARAQEQQVLDARYRMLVDNSSDVVLHTVDGSIEWVSPRAQQTLGWDPTVLRGSSLDDLWEADDLPILREMQDSVAAGEPARRVLRLRGCDESPRWAELALAPHAESDGRRGAVGQVHDVTEQVGAAQELERAESRWRDALNAFQEPFLALAPMVDASGEVVDFRYTYLNDAASAVLGRPPEEVLGHGMVELYPSNGPTGILDSYRATLLTGEPRSFLVQDFDENGIRGSFELDSFPFGDEIIVTSRDVTERQRFERALARSREDFQLIAENASDVVFRGDAAGVLDWVSPSVRRVLGVEPAELIGVSVTDVLHPDDVATVAAGGDRLETGGGTTFRARFRRADGKFLWCEVNVRPVVDDAGIVVARIGSLRDVHDQVIAEVALAEAQQNFRLIAENASDAVVRVGLDGVVEWAAGSTAALAGREPAELIGRPVRSLFVAEDVIDEDARTASVLAGTVALGPARLAHPDGTVRWISRRTQAVRGDDGAVQFLVSTWRDAQAEVAAQEALEESERQSRDLASRFEIARNEALEANVAKTAFLSRMSHELRTPLNAILGFGQILQMDEISVDQQQSVEQILAGGRLLLDLINEILDISRIEAGRLSLSMEAVAVSDAVAAAMDLVRPLATRAGVELFPPDPRDCAVHVWADRQRVIQVLLNLLTNAVKYNRVGGTVRVRCATEEDGFVAVSVQDTGVGIAAQNMPYLFRPFERLGAEATTVEGTGIGLSLAAGLARVMSGRIEVESTLGEGSTFTVLLPRTEPAELTEGEVAQAPDSGAPRASRVLYIEDNPANMRLMRRILADRPSIDLVVSTTGGAGLAIAIAEPPDLVLLDLHLPDMSGEDVLRRLRTEHVTSEVPVVIVTADASPAMRRRMAELGARVVLTKPVAVADVLAWVDDPLREETP